MEFRILGPLSVVSNGDELQVSGAQRRAVLGMLLVHANYVVSADTLIEDLWEGHPPRSASTTLQTYVYQLRKTIGLESLRTRPSGYLLEIEPDDLDALRFAHAVEAVRRADTPSPQWVAERLRAALGWWRGPALADFAGLTWARSEAARLETLRLGALEDLMEARLAAGEHTAVAPELETLVAEHPLRERFWAQLMLALYRSNRQADALRAYSRLRAVLGEELGIEPGKDIARLETSILRHDPELDLHLGPAPPPVPDQPAKYEPLAPSTRRRRRLVTAIAVLTVITIIAGVMTALAIGSNRSASTVPAPTGYRPRFRSTACPSLIRQGDSSVRCGELTVPEERSRLHGRTVTLGVFRYPARVPHPTSDPVVQVPGDFRLVEPPGDGTLRARGDSIYLAGRGYFGSRPRLTCPEVNDATVRALTRPLRSPQSEAEFLAAVQSCRARWESHGVHLTSYSAAERAADVRDLAFALGITHINLLAGRDSTTEAHDIAGRFPGLVRSVLLVNVTPPQANRWNGAITNAAGAFDRYFADCSGQPRCATTYPNLPDQLHAAYTRNRANAVTYITADPRGPDRPPIPVLLDGDRAVQIATLALDDPAALPLVAAALAAPTSGQAAVDYGTSHLVAPDDASWGALLSTLCIDEYPSLAREGLTVEGGASPEFGFVGADPLLDSCPIWRTSATHPAIPSPVATPTLILEGTLDPFTSPDWAQATARSFGQATVVQLPHLGDVSLTGNPCVTNLRSRFLADPEHRVDPRACYDQIGEIQFSGT
jgi:DNA-binding SARP family transcriptional activator/pimeloyl-ACP methyl ester carboxylesterase